MGENKRRRSFSSMSQSARNMLNIIKQKLPFEKILVWIISSIIIFTFIYYLIYYYDPDAFSGMDNGLDCLYFSCVTQSTVGYGDILPVKKKSKLICGIQILVTLFAGAYIVGHGDEKDTDQDKKLKVIELQLENMKKKISDLESD